MESEIELITQGSNFIVLKKSFFWIFIIVVLCLVWVYLIKNRVIVWKWRSVETLICAAPVFRVSRFQFYSIFMWKLNSIVVGRRRHPFKLRLQTWRYGFIIVLRLQSDSQIYILLRRESRSQYENYAILLSSPIFIKNFVKTSCSVNWVDEKLSKCEWIIGFSTLWRQEYFEKFSVKLNIWQAMLPFCLIWITSFYY